MHPYRSLTYKKAHFRTLEKESKTQTDETERLSKKKKIEPNCQNTISGKLSERNHAIRKYEIKTKIQYFFQEDLGDCT